MKCEICGTTQVNFNTLCASCNFNHDHCKICNRPCMKGSSLCVVCNMKKDGIIK